MTKEKDWAAHAWAQSFRRRRRRYPTAREMLTWLELHKEEAEADFPGYASRSARFRRQRRNER